MRWHAGCVKCRKLIFVMAGDEQEPPKLPTRPIYALCPYCLQAAEYAPKTMILHTGCGTIYFPPDRNLTDTTILVAGFIAAMQLARAPEIDRHANSPKLLAAAGEGAVLATALLMNIERMVG